MSPEFSDRPTAADAAYEVDQLDDTGRLVRFLEIWRYYRIADTLRSDYEAGRLDIDSYSWELFNAIADVLPRVDVEHLRGAVEGLPRLSEDVVEAIPPEGSEKTEGRPRRRPSKGKRGVEGRRDQADDAGGS